MKNDINLLFICSRNQWRSPTAEQVWKKHSGIMTRSAGTSPKAKRTVNQADIYWADVIFVMEKKHNNRLVAKFTRMLDHKSIHVLDIPDEYRFMDPVLIEEIEHRVADVLSSQS